MPAGTIVATREGIRVRIRRDKMFRRIYLFGEYESAATRIFRRLVRPGDVVIDAGANFGWFTCLFAKQVGHSGQVHAFEPVADIADQTRDTLQINAVGHHVYLNICGLGASEGEFTVYSFPGKSLGHASATDLGRADAIPHKCAIATLDGYVQKAGLSHVDLIKADVEGHELELFRGARKLLGREDAPILAFEINQTCLRDRGLRPAALGEFLRDVLGYTSFWQIGESDGPRSVQAELADLDANYAAAKPATAARLAQALQHQ